MHQTSTATRTCPTLATLARALGIGLLALLLCSSAAAQTITLLRESFRPGPRPHGGNGRLRNVQIHDTLKDYWAQVPEGAMWITTDPSGGTPTWLFAGSSLDPSEVDLLDEYNGTGFSEAGGVALLPFIRPATPFTLSASVVMGQGSTAELRLGYTASLSLSNNLATNSPLYVTLNGQGHWEVRSSTSGVLAAGTTPLYGEMGSGWLHVELTYDPAASTISGRIMNETFGPTVVAPVAATSYFGMETANSWGVVNNLSITTGTPLAAAVTGPASVCPGQTVTLTAESNVLPPLVSQWTRDWMILEPGLQPDGSVISMPTPETLVITGATSATAGTYRFHIASGSGSILSNALDLQPGQCGCSLADVAGGGSLGNLPDGTLDGSDFIAFINSFGLGDATVDPTADVAGGGSNGDQPDGTIDGSDFIAFINAFAAGC
jgi:hypothetical protein